MVTFSFLLTVGQELQQRQVDGPLPARVLLQRDAVARGGEHLAAADGHQLAAFVFAGHVVEHGGVVDEGVQFAVGRARTERETEVGAPPTAAASPPPSLFSPGLEAVQGVFHPLLVVLDHVRVHLGVVAPYVALRAAVWDGAKAEGRVLLLGLLEL